MSLVFDVLGSGVVALMAIGEATDPAKGDKPIGVRISQISLYVILLVGIWT